MVDKNILLEIVDLSAKLGSCVAKNSYFMSGFGLSEATVKRSIQKLEQMGMITVTYKVARQGRKITPVQSDLVRPAQNELVPVQNELMYTPDKSDNNNEIFPKNDAEYKRVRENNISKDISENQGKGFGNPLVNYAIKEFKRVFGYPPSSQKQPVRNGAYTWIRSIQAKLKPTTPENELEVRTQKFITMQLEWLKRQQWADSVIGFRPLQTHLIKFIVDMKNGKSKRVA